MFFGGRPKDQSSEQEKPVSETTDAPAANVTAEAAQAPATVANEAAATPAALESDPEHDHLEAGRRTAAARGLSTMFGEIVSLLMRTPPYKELWLADLEWLVMPAICSGQVSLATTKSKTGATMTVGVVLWARVSDKVDQRLDARPEETVRLATNEWTSGDIIWIVASAGEGRVLGEMLKRLTATEWAGRDVKMIVRAIDGKPMVVSLATGSAAAA